MLEEIMKKKKILSSYKPFPEDFRVLYDNLDLLDLAYMNLKLDGSNLTKEGVNEIIKGEVIDNITLMEHQEVVSHKEILKTFADMQGMDMDLDEKQIFRLYKSLTGKSDISYRSKSSILYHLDYMPPPSVEIEDRMRDVFIRLFKTDFGGDYIKKAISLHNGIIEVYPYDNRSETLARVAMEYELIHNGFPVIPFDLSESDYNMLLIEYLKTGENQPLYENLIFSADRKLNILINLLE